MACQVRVCTRLLQLGSSNLQMYVTRATNNTLKSSILTYPVLSGGHLVCTKFIFFLVLECIPPEGSFFLLYLWAIKPRLHRCI
jgi:hypothetical protein